MKHEKYMPAVQFIKEHSALTHASSGGSGTLNNPVHKVPKVHLHMPHVLSLKDHTSPP